MRKFIAILSIGIAGTLFAACGGSSTPSTPEAVVQSPTQKYLNQLYALGVTGGTSTLTGLGDAACADFNGGDSVDQVVNDGTNAISDNPGSGLTYDQMGEIIGAAVRYLCPMYLPEVQSYLQSQGVTT